MKIGNQEIDKEESKEMIVESLEPVEFTKEQKKKIIET